MSHLITEAIVSTLLFSCQIDCDNSHTPKALNLLAKSFHIFSCLLPSIRQEHFLKFTFTISSRLSRDF